MSRTISQMIVRLEGLHKNKSPILDKIRSYSELIDALKELNDMIEMNDAKVSIVLQLECILVRLANGKNGSIFDDQMLHSVISGPPGTGKTHLGKILAKIWHSLGLLKGSPVIKETEKASAVYEKAQRIIEATNIELIKVAREMNMIARDLNNNGSSYRGAVDLFHLQKKMINLIRSNQIESNDTERQKEPIFKVVSRVDFVAGYVGQTAIKTRKLLEGCLGGVLFIDEAYSLINGEKDQFGMECLTTLNQFMSEHPDEIIIIFGGYNDLMNETIFLRQPGLKRRCSWFFDVSGYSGEGLASIFKFQLKKYDWELTPTVDAVEFFTRHIAKFSNYGGDTEKFAFYCKLYHMDSEFVRISDDTRKRRVKTDQIITQETMEIALAKYELNRVERSSEVNSIPFGFYT